MFDLCCGASLMDIGKAPACMPQQTQYQLQLSAGLSAIRAHASFGQLITELDPHAVMSKLPLPRYETIKAADAVAALKASLKPTATVKRDGVWQNTDATLLVPGASSRQSTPCKVPPGNRQLCASAMLCSAAHAGCSCFWMRWHCALGYLI
jgi:hypothetical protein